MAWSALFLAIRVRPLMFTFHAVQYRRDDYLLSFCSEDSLQFYLPWQGGESHGPRVRGPLAVLGFGAFA
jgi:hypothetical protein